MGRGAGIRHLSDLPLMRRATAAGTVGAATSLGARARDRSAGASPMVRAERSFLQTLDELIHRWRKTAPGGYGWFNGIIGFRTAPSWWFELVPVHLITSRKIEIHWQSFSAREAVPGWGSSTVGGLVRGNQGGGFSSGGLLVSRRRRSVGN